MSDSNSTSNSSAAEVDWRHLHPLSPLLRGGLALLVIVGIVIASFRDVFLSLFIPDEVLIEMGPSESDLIEFIVEENLVVWAFLAVVLLLLLIVFFSWLGWRFNTFRISGEAVEERSGVIFRQHRRAPLDRIQSVNLQRPLLARLVGLTAVEVQTGGQGGKVELRYLAHSDAKDIRERILIKVGAQDDSELQLPPDVIAGRSGAVGPSGQPYRVADAPLDQRLSEIADFDIDPEARTSGSLVSVPVGRLVGSLLLGSEMMWLVFIIVVVAVSSVWLDPLILTMVIPAAIVLVSVLLSQFNKGFNFVLSRSGSGVRVGAGLTSTVTETVPFERIHAVEARQPLGWRPFGWWRVRITTAGHAVSQGGQSRLQNMVLPVGKLPDVVKVLETILPGAHTPERSAEFVEGLVGTGHGYARGGRGSAWVLWFGRRRAGIKVEGEVHPTLFIRRGALTRVLCMMPVVRAQSVQLSRQGFHRVIGLAALMVHTVLGPVQMQMRGLDLRTAQQIYSHLAATIVWAQQKEADELDARVQAAAIPQVNAISQQLDYDPPEPQASDSSEQ